MFATLGRVRDRRSQTEQVTPAGYETRPHFREKTFFKVKGNQTIANLITHMRPRKYNRMKGDHDINCRQKRARNPLVQRLKFRAIILIKFEEFTKCRLKMKRFVLCLFCCDRCAATLCEITSPSLLSKSMACRIVTIDTLKRFASSGRGGSKSPAVQMPSIN